MHYCLLLGRLLQPQQVLLRLRRVGVESGQPLYQVCFSNGALAVEFNVAVALRFSLCQVTLQGCYVTILLLLLGAELIAVGPAGRQHLQRVAVLAGVVAGILHVLWPAPQAALAAYIVPAWGEAGDEATRAMLLSDAKMLVWVSSAMISVFLVTVGIAFIAFSVVMLRIGGMLWTGLGWIGIGSGIFAILGAFQLAAEEFAIAGLIGVILEIIWFSGVGFGRGASTQTTGRLSRHKNRNQMRMTTCQTPRSSTRSFLRS